MTIRGFRTVLIAVAAIGLLGVGPEVPPKVQVLRAQDFVDGIGVVVHITYTDGGYVNIDQVAAALTYLGVRHVRDKAPDPDPKRQGQKNYGKLAAQQFRFDLMVKTDIPATLGRVHDFAAQFPGAVAAIEGPNEVNNWPVTYKGQTGTSGTKAFQAALYDAVKSDPVLKDLPVYNFTDWPYHAGKADLANIHPYSKKGDQPSAALERELAAQSDIMPGVPVVATEAGYYTLPGPYGWGGVDEATQAKLILNLLLDAARLRLKRTYLYQLLDAYPDYLGRDPEKHFGLFTLLYQPKPAATAIRNLTRLLEDKNQSAGSFALRAARLSVDRLPATARTLQIQKSDGWTILAIWDEPDIWDERAAKAIPHAATPITVQIAEPRQSVLVYEPTSSEQAILSSKNVQRLTANLGDAPVLVAISPD